MNVYHDMLRMLGIFVTLGIFWKNMSILTLFEKLLQWQNHFQKKIALYSSDRKNAHGGQAVKTEKALEKTIGTFEHTNSDAKKSRAFRMGREKKVPAAKHKMNAQKLQKKPFDTWNLPICFDMLFLLIFLLLVFTCSEYCTYNCTSRKAAHQCLHGKYPSVQKTSAQGKTNPAFSTFSCRTKCYLEMPEPTHTQSIAEAREVTDAVSHWIWQSHGNFAADLKETSLERHKSWMSRKQHGLGKSTLRTQHSGTPL